MALLRVLTPCRLQQLLQPVKPIQIGFGSMCALTEKVHLLELRSEQLRILSSCTGGHRAVSVRTSRRVIAGAQPGDATAGQPSSITPLLIELAKNAGSKRWWRGLVCRRTKIRATGQVGVPQAHGSFPAGPWRCSAGGFLRRPHVALGIMQTAREIAVIARHISFLCVPSTVFPRFDVPVLNVAKPARARIRLIGTIGCAE